MQRISLARRRADQRPYPLSCARRARAAGPDRSSVTAPVETLAPDFAQALPSLEGQPHTYSLEVNGEMLYDLCAALVRMNLGTPELWADCGEDPLLFAQRSIVDRIGAETIGLLESNIEYHFEVSDVVGEDSAGLSSGQLTITIHCGGCGYLKIGPALRALESEEEGLGAAFYWTLIRSLYRVMRIYDHSDAEAYQENLIEYAREDDPANRDQYEFPEVEKALPECIRESLKPESRRSSLNYRRMLSRHSTGRYRNWIQHVEMIAKLSRVNARPLRADEFDGYYDAAPVPALLIVFEEHDAVAACFDEESQHMLEGSSEPTFLVVFASNDAEECSRAMRAAERFIRVNREVCELIEAIQGENGDEGRNCDRRDASLRTE